MNTNISGGGLYVEHDAHVVSGSRIWLACVARGRHVKGRKASSFSPLAHSRDQNKPAPAIQASICYRAQRSSNLSIVE